MVGHHRSIYHRDMATDKRARQRQNRAEKQAAEAKVLRRRKLLKTGRRIAIYGLLALAVLLLANLLLGGSGDDGASGIAGLALGL